MATITIDDKTAREIYPTAPPALKAIMDKSFPTDFFVEDIIARITSFEAACEYNNTNPHSLRFILGTRNQIYQERVAEIVKALNQGWLADYDNGEEKWSPWFYLNQPGFRFNVSYYDFSFTGTTGGSRFALKNKKLSDYAAEHFVEEYKNWLMPCDETAVSFDEPIVVTANNDFAGDIAAWEAYIIPRTNSFEAACQEAGVSPTDPRFGYGTPDEIAYRRGKLVCDVMNAPFMDQMKDMTSRKWYAWMDKTETGFRFGDSFSVFTYTITTGGSRLRLCSAKLAKHFGETFAEMMAPYWWNE